MNVRHGLMAVQGGKAVSNRGVYLEESDKD